jgi:hypothetical protein
MEKTKYAFSKVSIAPLRADKSDKAEIVSQVLFGEIVEIIQVENNWTKLRTYLDNYEGWSDTKQFTVLSEKEMKKTLDTLTLLQEQIAEIKTPWGNQFIFKGAFVPADFSKVFKIGSSEFEFINLPSKKFVSIEEAAISYLNSPYLWGGKTPFGIDCSGFTQQVFRFFDFNLPRDCSQQIEHGSEIPFENSQVGDLAFFHNPEGKIIHVGIILAEKKIIHASGFVKIDLLKEDGIYSNELGLKTHALSKIKRL